MRALAVRGRVPADMRLAVSDPGTVTHAAVQVPAIDTDTLPSAPPADRTAAGTTRGAGETAGGDGLALRAATYTPRPKIYSRAQWGADERMRDASSLHYFEVHAGFVHHTVNANNYTRAQVPGIIRGIYAYHTQSKGWSDIGYNFLVDRFGRIWEGRYGGVDRPVVGAHTLGYNDYAFAMSAIGNFDEEEPSSAIVQAYGALFAWKLSLHGVDASSRSQRVGPSTFRAINGHRDAGQTACPGRYLYARLSQIRQLASADQKGWAGRELESNLAGNAYPDLVVRRTSDQQAVVIPTGGLSRFGAARAVSTRIAASDTVLASPDLTSDGRGDLVVRSATGVLRVLPGDGRAGFGRAVARSEAFAGRDLITAVGDLDRDGRNDLVARKPAGGRLLLYRGNGHGAFASPVSLGSGWGGVTALAATGDLDGDGRPDLVARDSEDRMWLRPGTGAGRLGAAVAVPGRWGRYDTVAGYGDFDGDGRHDLVGHVAGVGSFLLPARGDGTFGHRLGPFPGTSRGDFLAGADLVGRPSGDLLARTATGLVVHPSAGTFETGRPIATGVSARGANALLNAGDWDRDGRGDLLLRTGAGNLVLRSGDGHGGFPRSTTIATGFGGVGLLAAVGDMTGDGWPDLMGQPPGGAMRIYPGHGLAGLARSYVAYTRIDAGAQIAAGRWDGDGAPDSLFRRGDRLVLAPGNGPGGLTGTRALPLDLAAYDWVVGVSDADRAGHPDLVVRARRTGYLWLLPGTADGFGPRRFLGEGMKGYDLAG